VFGPLSVTGTDSTITKYTYYLLTGITCLAGTLANARQKVGQTQIWVDLVSLASDDGQTTEPMSSNQRKTQTAKIGNWEEQKP
jgi:hypothetical protein